MLKTDFYMKVIDGVQGAFGEKLSTWQRRTAGAAF